MARTVILSLAAFFAVALHAQEERLSIRFASGSAALDERAITALSTLCERSGVRVPGSIRSIGHTDDVGSTSYNKDLSRRRAEAVRQQLQETCPALNATSIHWNGEDAPVADNTTGSGRAHNRRVELVLAYDATDGARTDTARSWQMHPHVEQLLHAADKAREVHRVDASVPIDITASDGIRIRIAANAIVDEQGRPVGGPVDISYRSFMEPYEIIASGIPMHVKTADGPGHMETAGMYELYASQNGDPVQLKAGERIGLERPETAAIDPSFTGWVLDPTSGAWAAGGTITRPASVVVSSTQAINNLTTRAVSVYWREVERLASQERPDTTLFDARRASGEYCHLSMCDTTAPGRVGWRTRRDRYEEAGVPRIQVIAHKGMYDADNLFFNISVKPDKQFPEWRRLPHKAVWRYTGEHGKTMFKRLYGRRHVYQDIDLAMEPDGVHGTLRLKENGEWLEIPIDASYNRTTGAQAMRWDRSLVAYEKSLTKHRKNFDRDITRKHKRYQREHVNEHLMAWKRAKPDMNPEEAVIRSEEWRDYAAPRRPRPSIWRPVSGETENALASVRNTFGLDGFGIYNIDRIMKMANQQNVMASTQDEEGKPFPWVAAYVVLKNENSVITYWGDGRGEQDNMLVSPGKMKSIFLVDDAGNVATASTAPLNTGESRATLVVKHLDPSTDIQTLRAIASK